MPAAFSLVVLAAQLAAAPPPEASKPVATGATDICLAMIPPKLAATLQQNHPDYVLPKLTDARVDRLLSIAESGAWPCPFVVAADFDGDDRLDRALILHHREGATVRLIAARNLAKGWTFDLQQDWPLPIDQIGLEPLEPGLYEQTHSGNAAAELDNLKSIQADHAGFAAGQNGKPRRAYFYENEWHSIAVTETPDDEKAN